YQATQRWRQAQTLQPAIHAHPQHVLLPKPQILPSSTIHSSLLSLSSLSLSAFSIRSPKVKPHLYCTYLSADSARESNANACVNRTLNSDLSASFSASCASFRYLF